MSEIQVVDDFLPKEDFEKILNVVATKDFPWYISDSSDYNNDGNTQLFHILYNNNIPFSKHFEVFNPLYHKLNIFSLFKVRLIATLKYNGIDNKFHSDTENIPVNNVYTAVYYLNDNDGGTEFEDTKNIVHSKENRVVIFPSQLKHRTIKHKVDIPFRYVLNVNYVRFDEKMKFTND